VLKIVENLWAVGALPRIQPGELTVIPRPPSWWEGVAALSPIISSPLSAFGLDFRPFGPYNYGVLRKKITSTPWGGGLPTRTLPNRVLWPFTSLRAPRLNIFLRP